MSAPTVAAVVVLVVAVLLVGRALAGRRRARRHDGVISTWTRHPATRDSATVRVLRDPDEVATAADRAAERERETAQMISDRVERLSRMSRRRNARTD